VRTQSVPGVTMKRAWVVVILIVVVLAAAIKGRWVVARLLPIHHTGTVMRIKSFHKGFSDNNTRQQRQFAIIFEDGFDCEGFDTSLAAVEEGDVIEIRAYHDVEGFPILNPEWWECDEAQLVQIVTPRD